MCPAYHAIGGNGVITLEAMVDGVVEPCVAAAELRA
jgi:hypothetical protein